jgi:hypothetical protein
VPLDPTFVADSPYGPDGLFIDDILAIDRDAGKVVGHMPTHDELPITRTQRAHPVFHPRHIAGGLIVHLTGVMGLVHAYYVLELRHAAGWIGYGGRIHGARFKALAKPGEPMVLECAQKQVRRGDERILARYDFRFLQGETLVYEGDQTALWMKIPGR